MSDPTQIADYYDTSTRRFLAVGGSGQALAIHRLLWGAGVSTPEQAAAYVNGRIRAVAEQRLGDQPGRVYDLGCGVGGTVMHLARDWPMARFTGVTISAAQVALAGQIAQRRGLADRCHFLQRDFTQVEDLPQADLVIAVESHVHAPSAAVFLGAAAGLLREGGVLVVVDDMLRAPEATLPKAAQRRVAAFRRGWRLGHVPDRAGLIATAQAAGLTQVAAQDLTPLLRLNRWRDRALHVAGPVADALGLHRWPFFGNIIGGNALTRSYQTRIMRYTLMALRKSPQGAG